MIKRKMQVCVVGFGRFQSTQSDQTGAISKKRQVNMELAHSTSELIREKNFETNHRLFER